MPHPSNFGLGRQLASRRQEQTIAIWRAAEDGSGMQELTARLAAQIYVPSNEQALATLAELGGARASHVGELPALADVTEGDELRSSSASYIVERAIQRETLTWCALSEIRQ